MEILMTEYQGILDGKVILDCNDRIHNYSRVPLHRIDDNGDETLPEIIIRINNDYKYKYENTYYARYAEYYLVITTLLSDFFMRHGEPLHVAEIGCNNGTLSTQIAQLLARFDPKADYICVCDTIGNESGNSWLNEISGISEIPSGLSFLAADFENTLLRDNYLDYTVINGTVPILNPMEVIQESARITTEGGRILLFSENQYLLDDTFQLMFSERREWRFNSRMVIQEAEMKNKCKM